MTSTPTTVDGAEHVSSPAPGAGPAGRRLTDRLRALRSPWVAGPLLVYLVLVLAGVTQSSVGIEGLRTDPADEAGFMLDAGLEIRSDEYLTSTPLAIGVMASGEGENRNPLSAPQGFYTLYPSTPVSSVVLFDGAVLRAGPLLPDQMLLAARWWLPWLLLALGTPAMFATLVGRRWLGAFAAALLAFSPMSAWWSFGPLGMLGFTIAGGAALQRSALRLHEGDRTGAVLWGALSALLLARTPLHYQPWALVVAPAILLTVVAGLVAERERRRAAVVSVALTAVASFALLAGVVVENLESIRAGLGTVYPGARVSGAAPNPFQEMFGATALGRLEGATVLASNHSEISSSFAVAAVWVVLLLAYGLTYRGRSHRAATLTLLGVTAFWFAWSMVESGTRGQRIPVLNLVPSGRSAEVVGYLAVLVLCLALPGLADRPRRGFALLSAGVVGLVAAYAASLLRANNLPDMTLTVIWGSSLLLALVVLLVTRAPRSPVGYAAGGVLAFALVWQVNPVLVGLGDLRDTPVADDMLAAGRDARADGTLWASDSLQVDALLAATGVPSLSSRQIAGPDLDGWELLDPDGDHETVWNRGGSFITFRWTDADEITMSNPFPDVIEVSGSPCAVAERVPGLERVVSTQRLDDACLTPVDSFPLGGDEQRVYAVG